MRCQSCCDLLMVCSGLTMAHGLGGDRMRASASAAKAEETEGVGFARIFVINAWAIPSRVSSRSLSTLLHFDLLAAPLIFRPFSCLLPHRLPLPPLCFCPAESAAPPLNPSAPEWADLVRQLPQRLLDVRRSGIGASESVLIDDNVDSYASEALPCNGFCAISPDSATQFGTPLAVDGAVLLSSERLDLQVVADPPA